MENLSKQLLNFKVTTSPEGLNQLVSIDAEHDSHSRPVLPDLYSVELIHPLKRCKHLLRGSAHAEEPIIHPIKAPATILGMAGAVFVAMPATILRLAGFGCWLIANGLWVIQGKKVNDFYLMLLFSFYFVTAAFGVYNLT